MMFGECPNCHSRLAYIDSRPAENYRRRRAKCQSCGHKHSTIEITSASYDNLFLKSRMADQLMDTAKSLLQLEADYVPDIGRLRRGPTPKFDEADIRRMKSLYEKFGIPLIEIGRRFGVAGETVRRKINSKQNGAQK